jgi:CheY-like chemotaxis protein
MPLRGRVLVIEGDARVRAEIAHGLEDRGAEVIVAADGRDGLARLEAGADPSVVLVDLRRPRLGGAAFVEEVRADPRFADLPIITMSGGAKRRPVDLDDVLGIALSLLPRA